MSLLEALRAFARGSLLRFGWNALGRGPALMPQLLAVCLLPWTLALGASAQRHLFPNRGIQLAWMGFDVVLASTLFLLAQRVRPWLLKTVAAAVTADATLTFFEAIAFNLPRLRTIRDGVLTSLAVLAPALAAVLLWRAERHAAGARRRRERAAILKKEVRA
jgi:phosphatidylglycerol lysyltransferase